jgi:hypothetical protein
MLNLARNAPFSKGAQLVAVIVVVYFLVLTFIFPGYFSPYWPVHSDAYIFIGSTKQWLAEYGSHTIPRPLGFALEQVLYAFGLRTGLFFNALVPLCSMVLTVGVICQWLAIDRLHPVSLLAYLICLMANPNFYVAHTYDQFSNLEYLIAILGLYLWVGRPAGRITRLRTSIVSVLVFASAFCKEVHLLSMIVLFGYVWFVEHRDTPVVWLPLTAAFAGPACAFAYMRSGGAIFTSGQQSYDVILAPQSVVGTWWSYLKPNLIWPVLLLLIGALVLARRDGKIGKALILCFSGILALAPYALLPHHVSDFYSWSAAMLLTSPVLFIGSISRTSLTHVNRRYGPLLKWSNTIATAGLAGLALVAWQKYYAQQQWTLDRQQEQRLLLTGLEESNQSLSPGSRVLVSGMTSVYHPFQWPAFAGDVLRNAGQIDFVSYNVDELSLSQSEHSRTRDTKVRFISTAEVTIQFIKQIDQVILFNESGRIVGHLSPPYSVLLVQTFMKSLHGEPVDCVRYPKLWENRAVLAAGADKPYDLLALGAARYDPAYDSIAEVALQRAIASIPNNPYPYFYLGTLKERRGEIAQARQWFALALDTATRTGASNPAFFEGVMRTH